MSCVICNGNENVSTDFIWALCSVCKQHLELDAIRKVELTTPCRKHNGVYEDDDDLLLLTANRGGMVLVLREGPPPQLRPLDGSGSSVEVRTSGERGSSVELVSPAGSDGRYSPAELSGGMQGSPQGTSGEQGSADTQAWHNYLPDELKPFAEIVINTDVFKNIIEAGERIVVAVVRELRTIQENIPHKYIKASSVKIILNVAFAPSRAARAWYYYTYAAQLKIQNTLCPRRAISGPPGIVLESFPPIDDQSNCGQTKQWIYRYKWSVIGMVSLVVFIIVFVLLRFANSPPSPPLPPPPPPSPPTPWTPKQQACRGVNATSVLPAKPANAQEAAQVLLNYTAAFGPQLMRHVALLCAAQGMLGINASYRLFINACETLQRNFSGLTTQNVEGIFSNWPCALPPTPPPPSPPNPPSPPPSPPNPPSPPPSPPNPPSPPPSPQPPPPSPPPSPPVPPPSPQPPPPSPPPSPPNPPSPPPSPPAACDALGKPIANITQFTDGIKALQTIATTLLPSAPDTVVLKRILDWCVIDPNVGFKYLADYCAYLKSLNPTGTVGLILQMARYCLNRH